VVIETRHCKNGEEVSLLIQVVYIQDSPPPPLKNSNNMQGKRQSLDIVSEKLLFHSCSLRGTDSPLLFWSWSQSTFEEQARVEVQSTERDGQMVGTDTPPGTTMYLDNSVLVPASSSDWKCVAGYFSLRWECIFLSRCGN